MPKELGFVAAVAGLNSSPFGLFVALAVVVVVVVVVVAKMH